MVGEVVDGYIFGATEQVTTGKLQQQFTLSTISGLDRTHFGASTRPMTNVASLSTASLIGGEIQYLNTIDELHFRNAGEGAWSVIPQIRYLTNKSGGSVARGDVIVIDTTTAKSFTTVAVANTVGIIGVALDTISSNAEGPVQFVGYAPVNVTGSTGIGDFLVTSATAKKASPSATVPSNYFGRALTTSSTQVMAMLVGGSLADPGREFDPRQRRYFTDDFLNAAKNAASPFLSQGRRYEVSAGTISQDNTTFASDPGVVKIAHAAAGGMKEIFLDTTDAVLEFRFTKTNFSFKARVAASDFSNHAVQGQMLWALSDSDTMVNTATLVYSNNWVGFSFFQNNAGGHANFFFSVVNAGTRTGLDAGSWSVDTLYDIEMRRVASNQIQCFMNGVSVGTITATIPTVALAFRTLHGQEAAGSMDEYTDYHSESFDS
jgi:hypothetical protein